MSPQDTTNNAHQGASNNDETPEINVDAAESTETQAGDGKASAATQSSTEVTTLQKQAQDYLAGWQQERATFANYKKRIEREMKDVGQNAAVEAMMGLLPVIDDLERAMSSVPAELQGNSWLNGMSAVSRKFQKVLEDRGVTVIDPKGQAFDPNRHEAVAMEDSSEVESGHVTMTLQKGYALGERVLRPALVRVAN